VQDFATRFPSKVDEYENLLTGNPIWGMRTKGVARITAEDAVALGASGPTLRGSGVDFDLRRDMPYSGYENFKFKVPGIAGTATYLPATPAGWRRCGNRSRWCSRH
jgi:NADH-quinone oxidoreductase subunit D